MGSLPLYCVSIGELEGFIDTQTFDHIVIGGDFNVDFNRPSGLLDLLTAVMADRDLVAADFLSQPSIGFTYERDDGSAHSWPDHFLCDSSFLPAFTSVSKVDLWSNLSDHHPIAATFGFCCSSTPPMRSSHSAPHQSKVAWHRATSDQVSDYCTLVAESLPSFPVEVTSCLEAGCSQHLADLDAYIESLFECLSVCAHRTLPRVRSSSSRVPGWNRSARSLKDKADFWYNIWKSAGSPTSGVLYQIKRSSKSRYKYEVIKVQIQVWSPSFKKARATHQAWKIGCSTCVISYQRFLARHQTYSSVKVSKLVCNICGWSIWRSWYSWYICLQS